MQQLPDLSTLSSTQKDALVLELWAMVQTLTVQINELQARLNLNSRNSTSSDGLNKPQPKLLRKAGQRPVGGQKGHKAHTLCQVAEPNMVVIHAPPETLRCLPRSLGSEPVKICRHEYCVSFDMVSTPTKPGSSGHTDTL